MYLIGCTILINQPEFLGLVLKNALQFDQTLVISAPDDESITADRRLTAKLQFIDLPSKLSRSDPQHLVPLSYVIQAPIEIEGLCDIWIVLFNPDILLANSFRADLQNACMRTELMYYPRWIRVCSNIEQLYGIHRMPFETVELGEDGARCPV